MVGRLRLCPAIRLGHRKTEETEVGYAADDLLRHVQVLPVHELSVRPDHFLGEVAKRRAEQAVLVGRANVLGGVVAGVDGYQTIGVECAQVDTLASREGQGLLLRGIGDESRMWVTGLSRP